MKKIKDEKKRKKRQPQKKDDLKFYRKIEPILTSSTAQYSKPEQHNNQKYIGTIKIKSPQRGRRQCEHTLLRPVAA
jgi:hypothetical protein